MAKYRIIHVAGECEVEVRSGFLYSLNGDSRWEPLHLDWTWVRDSARKAGMTIVPVIEQEHPQMFEFRGVRYFLTWQDSKLLRIVRHENDEVEEITWQEFPEQLKRLL